MIVLSGAEVRGCILFSGCDMGSKSRIHNVIMDKCSIRPGCVIGEDSEQDREVSFRNSFWNCSPTQGTFVPKSGPLCLRYWFLLENDPTTSEIMDKFKDRYII